jgi:hypothetical protein
MNTLRAKTGSGRLRKTVSPRTITCCLATLAALAALANPVAVVKAAAPAAPTAPAALAAKATAMPASIPAPATVPVTIQGHSIVSLSLKDRDGRLRSFLRPQATIALPPGEYAVAEVQLLRGIGRAPAGAEPWFTHSADAPARLTVGAPLTPKLKTSRSGQTIVLQYLLFDAAGREYVGRTQSPAPPRVEIYARDRQVGSGSFSYG